MNKIAHKDQITAFQMMIILLTTQIGFGILSYSNQLAKYCGHDGWMMTIVMAIVVFGVAFCIIDMLKRFKNKSLFSINQLLYGKILGTILNLYFILYAYLISIISLKVFMDVVRKIILNATPVSVLLIISIIVPIYICSFGLKSIARMGGLLFLSLVSIVILLILVSPQFNIYNLRPIGYFPLSNLWKGLFISFFTFSGYELATVYYPNITDKENFPKYFYLGLFITTLLYLSIIIVTTGVFGENILKQYMYSLISLARIYNFPLIGRLDLFFVILWYPAFAGVLRSNIYIIYFYLQRIAKEKIKNSYLLAIVFILVTLGSTIPIDTIALDALRNYVSYMGFGINLLLIVSFFISKVKYKEVQS
jgi:spore germination protein (amino acid permease)